MLQLSQTSLKSTREISIRDFGFETSNEELLGALLAQNPPDNSGLNNGGF
jgi:hypothetical protein